MRCRPGTVISFWSGRWGRSHAGPAARSYTARNRTCRQHARRPARSRPQEPARLHAVLTILAGLACALSRERAVALMVAQRLIQQRDSWDRPPQAVRLLVGGTPPLLKFLWIHAGPPIHTVWRPGGAMPTSGGLPDDPTLLQRAFATRFARPSYARRRRGGIGGARWRRAGGTGRMPGSTREGWKTQSARPAGRPAARRAARSRTPSGCGTTPPSTCRRRWRGTRAATTPPRCRARCGGPDRRRRARGATRPRSPRPG
jgi:hypothetical protein